MLGNPAVGGMGLVIRSRFPECHHVMHFTRSRTFATLLAAVVFAHAACPQSPVDASAPIPKVGNKGFFEKHEAFLSRAQAGPIGLLLIGDSITEGWRKAPHIWEHYYAKYDAANFGIGGDQTQHVIWRIENGELDGIAPRVVVLMIGTNNSGRHSGGEIAGAVRKIVGMIRARLPETKVLVLAIFPRGPRVRNGVAEPWEQRMEAIRKANADLATLDDGDNIRFLDMNAAFLGNDGTIPMSIMPDQLHPSRTGYQAWAEAMQPTLEEMMR